MGDGETWRRKGSLLNRADPTPYSEVNFLLVPKFPINCVPQFRRARSLYLNDCAEVNGPALTRSLPALQHVPRPALQP